MPIVASRRGSGRRGQRGSDNILYVLHHSIRDGEDEYVVTAITGNKGAAVRLRVRSSGEEVLTAYLPPDVAIELGQWLLHLGIMVKADDVVSMLWRSRRSGGKGADMPEHDITPQDTREEGGGEEVSLEDEFGVEFG